MSLRPSFAPLPADPAYAAYGNDSERYSKEQNRTSWKALWILSDAAFNSYVSYAWGFTIYRLRFEGDSDERFQSALDRWEQWTRWVVRAARYGNDSVWEYNPSPAGVEPTDQLADRLYNEVLEFVPDDADEPIVLEPEGEEDFAAVGAAFSKWVASLNVDTSKRNARYDQCLIIDKASLESLEKLPETPPPLEHARCESGRREAHAHYYYAWLWVLDRKINDAEAAGEFIDCPPWLRLRVNWTQNLWFHGPMGTRPQEWLHLAEEDRHNWETVKWWNPQALIVNGVQRQTRSRGPHNFLEDLPLSDKE